MSPRLRGLLLALLLWPNKSIQVNLSRALRLTPITTPLSQIGRGAEGEGGVAFVGAGGKTTALFALARELVPRHKSVILTATTHLGAWQVAQAGRHIIAKTTADLNELPDTGVTLVTGPLEGGRTQPVSQQVLFWLHENTKSRAIPLLIEADGARQKPLKAPAAHEPPIPDFVDTVIVVAGLSGLGKPLTDEFVFRAGRFRELCHPSRPIVEPDMLVRVLCHPEGGLKNMPPSATRIALLNQAETPELLSVGGKMANDLLGHFDSILVGSLQQNEFQAFERTAGIILAAGESKRYGGPKQLLDWKGRPFVRQVAETAFHAGLWPVIVVTGFRAADVEAALDGLPVSIVRNDEWQSGQGLSIAAGVRGLAKNTGAAIFLLADQPQIPVEVIQALVENHTQNLPAILAPLVLNEKRANPVLFDRGTFPDLLRLTGDIGGRAIFDKHKVEYLPWHDDALLLDVDTPEDYERLKNLISPS